MSLRQRLAERLKGTVVVVGVGNPLRGDDAAGSLAARRLMGMARAHVIDAQEVPESYLGEVRAAAPDTVVLIDAVDLGAKPGSAALLEKEDVALYFPSTHRLPLSLVMEFVQCETGADVLLLAVQPRRVDFGAPVSDEVEASVSLLAEMLGEVLSGRGVSGPREDAASVPTPRLRRGRDGGPKGSAGEAPPGRARPIEAEGTVAC
jgi:hydrogenase 3 maturation protease